MNDNSTTSPVIIDKIVIYILKETDSYVKKRVMFGYIYFFGDLYYYYYYTTIILFLNF